MGKGPKLDKFVQLHSQGYSQDWLHHYLFQNLLMSLLGKIGSIEVLSKTPKDSLRRNWQILRPPQRAFEYADTRSLGPLDPGPDF